MRGKDRRAQRWLCTRSAYTIFHHYSVEKKKKETLKYWSAPLLSFSPPSPPIPSFIPAFNISRFTSHWSETCTRNTLARRTPAVNELVNVHKTLADDVWKTANTRRRWTRNAANTCAIDGNPGLRLCKRCLCAGFWKTHERRCQESVKRNNLKANIEAKPPLSYAYLQICSSYSTTFESNGKEQQRWFHI